jgi:Protein of unknown function, DUF481
MKIRYCSLIFLLLFIKLSPRAQIVNIESARMQSDTTGWMGGAGAGFTLAQNVEKIFILNMDIHLQYKTRKNLWLLLTSSNLLKAGDEKFFNNTFLHVRYNRKLNDWLRWEVFTQAQNNQVTQIDSRFLLGTGPRFKIFSNRIIRLYAATLVMYEREKETTKPVVTHNDIRSSNYASCTITPGGNIEIISTMFYQPIFNKPGDYRILNQSSLKVKASQHFSLSLRWNYLHDRFPAGTAPRTTYDFTTGIDYEF